MQLSRTLAALFLAGYSSHWAPADSSSASQPAPGLVADVRPLSEHFLPNAAVRVRFTLINESTSAVAIPLATPWAITDGLTLPVELLFGSSDQPALSLAYQKEAPQVLRPPGSAASASAPGAESVSILRLAPGASVGVDVDLTALTPSVRYPGSFRLEWKPLGGQIPAASAAFSVESRRNAIIVTDYGKINLMLNYEEAPRNVRNFLDLVQSGFYDGKQFHRIIPGELVQAGDPKGDGTGMRADGKTVPAEFRNTPFDIGMVAMARRPDDPNSASCQFMIGLGRVPDLDGQYTIIGMATDNESMRTLQQLASQRTGKRHRPIRPLYIRSINLVDSQAAQPRAARELSVTPGPASQPAERK